MTSVQQHRPALGVKSNTCLLVTLGNEFLARPLTLLVRFFLLATPDAANLVLNCDKVFRQACNRRLPNHRWHWGKSIPQIC